MLHWVPFTWKQVQQLYPLTVLSIFCFCPLKSTETHTPCCSFSFWFSSCSYSSPCKLSFLFQFCWYRSMKGKEKNWGNEHHISNTKTTVLSKVTREEKENTLFLPRFSLSAKQIKSTTIFVLYRFSIILCRFWGQQYKEDRWRVLLNTDNFKRYQKAEQGAKRILVRLSVVSHRITVTEYAELEGPNQDHWAQLLVLHGHLKIHMH